MPHLPDEVRHHPCACRGSAHVHVACLAVGAFWRNGVARGGCGLSTLAGAGAVALAEDFGRSLRKESHIFRRRAARWSGFTQLRRRGAATLERAQGLKSYGDSPSVAAVLNDLGIASGEEERFARPSRSMLPVRGKRTRPARAQFGQRAVGGGRYRRRSMSTNRPSV